MATDPAPSPFDPYLWRARIRDALTEPGVASGEVNPDSPHDGVYFAFEVGDDIAAIQADDSRINSYLLRCLFDIYRELSKSRGTYRIPIVFQIREFELIRLQSSMSLAIRGMIAWVANDGPHLVTARVAGPGQEALADQSWRDRPSML